MKLMRRLTARRPKIAVIRLQGMISAMSRGGLSDAALHAVIERAFSRGKPKAVALMINSPGGSPVQSSLIAGRIRRLSEEKNIPVIAFVEDVAASGGYWLASSADEIYANPASVIGSIGVISAGFGAQVFLTRQGLERRVYTAGESKSQLDPFKAEDPEDIARLQKLLDGLHQTFIAQVRERRGSKLKEEEPELFSGAYWLASQAQELGLIDGIGTMERIMKARFGDNLRFIRYGIRRNLLARFSSHVVQDALMGIEEKAALARFGIQ